MIDTTNKETCGIVKAWDEAAKDLIIKIESPFLLETHDKRTIKYGLLIKNFGSNLGTLILTIDYMIEADTARENGYYCSGLNPDSYRKYNRAKFIETLTDWGYFGFKKNTPAWYEGHLFYDE